MSEVIRVLVVDDHTVVRKGIVSLLTSPRYGIKVIGEAGDGVEATSKAKSLKPDVILLDMVMPRKSGLEAILEILQQSPDTRIIVLTSFGDIAKVNSAIQAGAMGYLLKESSPDQLINAIRSVSMGHFSLPGDMVQKVMQKTPSPVQAANVLHDPLSQRELDVLLCIAKGMSNREIADNLSIGTTTVRSHVSNLLNKLNLANRTQAALYAIEKGLTGQN